MLGLDLMMGWKTRRMPGQKTKKMLEELNSICSVGEDGTRFPLYLLQPQQHCQSSESSCINFRTVPRSSIQ